MTWSFAYLKRTICDFIASMADNYCIEFYGRLTSENPQSIFKLI
jgi:dGTPase